MSWGVGGREVLTNTEVLTSDRGPHKRGVLSVREDLSLDVRTIYFVELDAELILATMRGALQYLFL